MKDLKECSAIECKNLCFNASLYDYAERCKATLTPVCLAEISDEMLSLYETILNREEFGKLSKDEAFKVFDSLSQEMADYVGVEKADLTFKTVDTLQSYLSGFEFARIGKFMNYDEKMKFLSQNLGNGDYALSNLSNKLIFNYYSNKYYSQVKQRYKLNDNEVQSVITDESIVSSMRHEYQHLFQFAKVARHIKGEGVVEERYRIMALYSIMKLSLKYYSCHINEMEPFEENVDYFFDPFEVDARFSELSFVKKLIEDARVSQALKSRLNKFASYYYNYNFQCEGEANFSKLVEQNIKNVRSKFKKLFCEIPFAQEIVSMLDGCNMQKYLASIERQKAMYKNAFANERDNAVSKEC